MRGNLASGLLLTLLTGLLFGTASCSTVSSLQSTTVSQGGTASDILSQMVLDNLEMVRQESNALPWHLKITQGSIAVTDQISPSLSATWSSISRTAEVSGSRQWSVSWTVVPELSKAKLLKLQGLYQSAACRDQSVTEQVRQQCEQSFQATYGEGDQGPLDRPTGKFNGKYVWPKDGHIGDLTNLVMDVLASAPIDASERGLMLPGPPNRP